MNKKMTLEKICELGLVFSGGEEPPAGGDPPPVSVVNADGSFAEKWSEKYGEDNQAHLSRYKDFDSLVNSHIATKKKFGKNPDTLVEIPTDTSSDEVKAAFRKARGVPDSTDAYEYKMSDEMALKLGPLDDTKMTAFRDFAHKQEWSPKQFADALDFYHTNIASDIDAGNISFNEQKAAAGDACKAELRKQTGWQTEEEFKRKQDMANSIIRKYGGEDAVASFNAENSPQMVKFLNNVAESFSEAQMKSLAGTPTSTSGDIKAKVAEIREQMDKIVAANPVNFKINAQYKELEERKHHLYKQMPA